MFEYNYKLNDVIKITWVDSASQDEWTCTNSIASLEEVVSVGICIQVPTKEKNYVVIVQSITTCNESMFAQLAIPANVITKMVVIGDVTNEIVKEEEGSKCCSTK